ncbi:MAG: 50S ribosomal protein L13 [Phycisphaerae bacterium]
MKSYMAKQGELEAQWHVVDATDCVIGRLATRIATILMGKHKPEYTPHVDCGDFVVVLNAANVKFTGNNKAAERQYQRYSGYPGGQKVWSLEDQMAENPAEAIALAVRRMLPKSKLGKAMFKKLKVYNDDKHPHQAQQPKPLAL